MDKVVSIPFETTANYQATSPLNVRFWSQDINTAVLRFLITRNDFPLSLSEEHVSVIIALESGDSFISTSDVDMENEVEGVVTYTIPTEFLAAVSGTVTGQVYVATNDNEKVIVERKFTFEIENDLLSSIPSEEKIRYIKMFDDLKQDIMSRVLTLETQIGDLESFIEEVEQTTANGVTELTNLFNAKTITFNDNYTTKMADLNALSDDMTTYGDATIADMVAKKAAFDAAVTGADLVTDSEAVNWQKYKLTKDDGTRTYLPKGSFADVLALEPGYYETVSNDTPTQGFPSAFANAAFIEIDVTKSESASGRKQIQVTQSSRPQTFVKYLHTGGADENGWKEIPFIDPLDPYEKISGSQSKANTAENNAKAYADTKLSATRKTLFSGSVNGVGQNINLTESMDNYGILIVSGTYSGGTFNETILVSTIGTGVPIQRVNLSNTSGGSPNVFEMEITRVNSTRFNIARDNQYSILGESATIGGNSYTIQRIEAIK